MIEGMSTEQKILAWAEWSRSNNPIKALDYKSPSLALIRQHMGGGLPLPPLSDEEALKMDAVVVRLKIKQPQLYRAFVMYFIEGKSQRTIAKEFGGMSVKYANAWLKQAVCWIEGRLDKIDLDAA